MELLHALEGIRTPFLDTFFLLVTRLGEEVVAIVILCTLYWCIDKSLAYRMGVTYFFSGLMVQGLKVVFQVPRPWIQGSSVPVAGAVGSATGYSFPSGHSQSAGAIGGVLGFRRGGGFWRAAGCFALTALVGFSRLYLGVHTLWDVVAGLAISLTVAFVVTRFMKFDGTARSKPDLCLIAGMGALVLAVLAAAVWLALPNAYRADCVKTVGAGLGFIVGMVIERRYIRFSTAAKNIWHQLIKLVLGLAGVLGLKEGLGALFKLAAGGLAPGVGLALDAVRYFLIIFWAIALYPLIFKRIFKA